MAVLGSPQDAAMDRLFAVETQLGLMSGLVDDFEKLKMELREQKTAQAEKEKNFLDGLNKELADHKAVMNELYEGTKKEFAELKASIYVLYEKTNEAIIRIDKKLEERGSG